MDLTTGPRCHHYAFRFGFLGRVRVWGWYDWIGTEFQLPMPNQNLLLEFTARDSWELTHF